MIIENRIDSSHDPLFEQVWQLYCQSFPLYERHDRVGLANQLDNNTDYSIYATTEGGEFVGFIGFWHFEDLACLEHFAVAPEFRCGGRGRGILDRFIDSVAPRCVVGEIEPPTDELKIRRASFYKRAGFIEGESFLFPPYRGEGEPFPMIFISYPRGVDHEQFERYQQFLKEVVNGD